MTFWLIELKPLTHLPAGQCEQQGNQCLISQAALVHVSWRRGSEERPDGRGWIFSVGYFKFSLLLLASTPASNQLVPRIFF